MPPVNILIKPASSACEMDCTYCFYRDVAQNRETAFEGMLSLEAMERLVRFAMEYAEGSCTFAFQGGEPTLAGLDFYRETAALQRRYAKPGVEIRNTIQTNGYRIDERWARFFAEERYLVGLSLDGPAELHNLNRKDRQGKGTFNKVLQAAKLFDRFQVEYNILCVVTGKNARSIGQIYNFYKKQGFRWLQFIPCLEPLGGEWDAEPYHLSCKAYGEFLIRLFDLWYRDLERGEYVSIRQFDNWLAILMGGRPESCDMAGHCSVQFVVEGDGGVYPCDFYVLDQWRLGTVGRDTFKQMLESEAARRFVEASLGVPEECGSCPAYFLCRNGCRRTRLVQPDGTAGPSRYCEAYRRFFQERGGALMRAAEVVMRSRPRL